MKPIFLTLNLIFVWFGTTLYAGLLWSLHFFWFPSWRHLRVATYHEQFAPQTTAATKYFIVIVPVMFLALIILTIHEWGTRLKWWTIAMFLSLAGAMCFGTLRILPINKQLKAGVTDQAQLDQLLSRWIELNEVRFYLITLVWVFLVIYVLRKGSITRAMYR